MRWEGTNFPARQKIVGNIYYLNNLASAAATEGASSAEEACKKAPEPLGNLRVH